MSHACLDHYQVLGINRDSPQPQIRAAFRRLSKIHHPDLNGNSGQSNRLFRLILNAYEVISDEQKRREYDLFLETSSYIRSFGRADRACLGGTVSSGRSELLSRVNMVLWDVEEILAQAGLSREAGISVLKILTDLDRRLLEPFGFPDYFMEARGLKRIDPLDYIEILAAGGPSGGHLPYSSIDDYFMDIRKRAGRFISRYETSAGWPEGLPEGITGFFDGAVHHLAVIRKAR